LNARHAPDQPGALPRVSHIRSKFLEYYGDPMRRRLGLRLIMTSGSVLAAPALLGIATAPSLPWFFAAWALAGVAMASVLYQPAFAAFWWGPRRVTALTAVTLSRGLASTVVAPLTAALAEHLAWRQTYLVLAAVLAR
jgi:MFS family permease